MFGCINTWPDFPGSSVCRELRPRTLCFWCFEELDQRLVVRERLFVFSLSFLLEVKFQIGAVLPPGHGKRCVVWRYLRHLLVPRVRNERNEEWDSTVPTTGMTILPWDFESGMRIQWIFVGEWMVVVSCGWLSCVVIGEVLVVRMRRGSLFSSWVWPEF